MRKLGIVALIAFAMLSLGVGLAIWKSDAIQQSIERRVVQAYIDKIQPLLPFKIVDFKYDTSLEALKQGRLSNLKLVISIESYLVTLEGPIEVQRPPPHDRFKISFKPKTFIEPERSAPLDLDLWVSISTDLTSIDELGFKTQAKAWEWRHLNLKLEGLHLNALWLDQKLKVDVETKSATWSTPDESRMVQVTRPRLKAQVSLQLSPLVVGPQAQIDVRVGSAEALWDEQYADLPLEALPVSATVQTDLSKIIARVGPAQPWVKLEVTGLDKKSPTASFETRAIPLKEFVPAAIKAFQVAWPTGLAVTDGGLALKGSYKNGKAQGLADLKNLSGEWPVKNLALKNLDLNLPINTHGATTARLSAQEIAALKYRGRIEPTAIDIDWVKKSAQTQGPLGFKMRDIPIEMGIVKALLQPSKETPGKWEPILETSLQLSNTPIERLLAGVCVPTQNIPPALVSLGFKKIEITPDYIDVFGTAGASLFDGAISVKDIVLFDYLTDVPETQFSANWSGIQLDRLGEWLGFGKIDGTLEGYFSDVTFQALLPTQFDLRAEIKPRKSSTIVFSAKAMKNFAQLFAGEDLDEQLPGIADWIMFGWPSQLFGGYNVDYAGISIYSRQGSILVETLDPPEEKENHFILKGRRFNMPIQSPTYPVVLDAYAMGNFVRHMGRQLEAMKNPKQKESPVYEIPEEPQAQRCF